MRNVRRQQHGAQRADCKKTARSEPITYRNEDRAAAYTNARFRFLLLLAMHRLFPEKRVRILNSVGYGVYLRVIDDEMDFEMVRALEEEMKRACSRGYPL